MGSDVEAAIARLPETAREYARKLDLPPGDSRALFDALATEIESLRASLTRVEEERDEAVKALEPFADLTGEGDEDFDDFARVFMRFGRTQSNLISLGELRALRTLHARLSRATVTGANDEP